MSPTHIIAQAFGICSMISCFLVPMFKKKWQILTGAMFNNLFIGLNFILLGEFTSGLVSIVGIAQCLIAIFHVVREKPVPIWESIVFTVIGVLTSLGGLTKIIGIFPFIAIVSYNISVFVRKEQIIRWYLLINAGAWLIYDALIMSTSFFGHIIGFVSTAIALWKYRDRKVREKTE